jgi:hypothetical protein
MAPLAFIAASRFSGGFTGTDTGPGLSGSQQLQYCQFKSLINLTQSGRTTGLGAIFNIIPIAFPFLAPMKFASAHDADFTWFFHVKSNNKDYFTFFKGTGPLNRKIW